MKTKLISLNFSIIIEFEHDLVPDKVVNSLKWIGKIYDLNSIKIKESASSFQGCYDIVADFKNSKNTNSGFSLIINDGMDLNYKNRFVLLISAFIANFGK